MKEKLNSMFRALRDDVHGVVDLGVVLMIGIAFAALMVIAYIIWTLEDQLGATGSAANSVANVTGGFDDAVNLILIAVTVFILAIAISALLMLRGR